MVAWGKECGAYGGQKRDSDHVELHHVAVSSSVWVLGTEFQPLQKQRMPLTTEHLSNTSLKISEAAEYSCKEP